jgi:hypothetical protein
MMEHGGNVGGWLSLAEAAALTGLPVGELHRACVSGQLRTRRAGWHTLTCRRWLAAYLRGLQPAERPGQDTGDCHT